VHDRAQVRLGARDLGVGSRHRKRGELGGLRQRGGQYLVGTQRNQMKQFGAELAKEDWTQARPQVEFVARSGEDHPGGPVEGPQ
jgi:hypothetical protein